MSFELREEIRRRGKIT